MGGLMLRVIFSIIILAITSAAYAAPMFETIDESRQRHSAERYEQYEQNGRMAPLGGYNDKLGDPAPYGTERPGYVSPQPYGNSGLNNGSYQPQNNSRRY